LTAHIGTCIEPRRKKPAKTKLNHAAFCAVRHANTKTGPEGPCFRRVPIAYFNHRDGRNRDDGGDGGGDDNGDGGAGIAAALPRSETYSRGDDDGGGGDIVPVARFHLLTARRLIHQSLAIAN
jgi:hypothetical protein